MAKEWKELAEELYRNGLKDTEIARECGVCSKTIQLWRKEREYPVNSETHPDDKPNPCFDCQRNIMDCPWLHHHKPVPGWDAVLLVKHSYIKCEKREYVTWAIKHCPLYIQPENGREQD